MTTNDSAFYIVLGIATVIVVAVIVMLAAGPRTDATDDPNGSRSGLRLRRDYGTGCEYLEGTRGGLTPRMTADGRHSGCRRYGSKHDEPN